MKKKTIKPTVLSLLTEIRNILRRNEARELLSEEQTKRIMKMNEEEILLIRKQREDHEKYDD